MQIYIYVCVDKPFIQQTNPCSGDHKDYTNYHKVYNKMKLKIINKLKKTCNYLFKPLTVIFLKLCLNALYCVTGKSVCSNP